MTMNEDPIEFHGLEGENIEAAAPIRLTTKQRLAALVRQPLFWGGTVVVTAATTIGVIVLPGWFEDQQTAAPTPTETSMPVVTSTPT